MAGLQCNKFKGDNGKIILVLLIKPKRQRNVAWYKEKEMLAKAQEAGQILDEEQLAFLVHPGIPTAVLMANISNYGSDVISEEVKELNNIVFKVGQSAQIVHMLTKPQSFYDNVHKQALGYQNHFYLKKAQQMKPNLYDGIVIFEKHVAMPVIDNEETLILEEDSRSKMSEKAKDPKVIANKISYKPIDYEKLNRLTYDFGKCFTPQQELSVEQAFWLHISNPIIESSLPPVRVEDPNELPKLKDKDTTICKLKYATTSLRKNNKEEIVDHDRCDLATINAELENSVAKLLYENERLCKEINHVKQDLKAQIQDRVFVITSLRHDLRKLKRKATVDNVVQIPSATTVVPGMFKLDLEPLAPKLMHNRESHIFYLKHTQDQADILRGIVKRAKSKQPLDSELDFACKHAKRIQELLVYVQDTCPSAIRLSEIKVARTPMTKIKKVTFSEPITTSSTNQETHDSNKPMLHSTGVKCSTSASGLKPSGNTKNNRISQPSSSNKINKVEDQPRSVKVRKNNKNRVTKVKCDDHVMQSSSIANFVSVFINNAPVKNSINDVKSGCLCAICGYPDCTLVSELRMFETHNRESLSAHELFQEAAAPRAKVLANSHVSISISQDAPSTSIPSLQAQEHSPIISQGFEESQKTPMFHDDPLNESPQDLPSQGLSSNVIQIHTLFEHHGR
nr:hypothetical protein [Tanacetum cinerariifolium]